MPSPLVNALNPAKDTAHRRELHDEVHARPPEGIRLPAQVLYVAMLNRGVSRELEYAQLLRLPECSDLAPERMAGNFLSLPLVSGRLVWERHTEFSRYTLIRPLGNNPDPAMPVAATLAACGFPPDWLASLPGEIIAAIELFLYDGDPHQQDQGLLAAQAAFATRPFVAAMLGVKSDALVMTDFAIQASGFERFMIIAPSAISEGRAGRISQRLLELETYRLMALRGFPVAKNLGPALNEIEKQLALTTHQMAGQTRSDQDMLDDLTSLAARTEQLNAEHGYRFSATRAYHGIVIQRIAELNETAVPATQTIGEFLGRRLSPAMSTVEATVLRLGALSERISRASALLRTRVDIATEEQNRLLLERLNKGQETQLALQTTVEGLSIAAISYYMVSLVLYGAKALKAAGVPLNPEVVAGLAIPVVLFAVWKITRRVHDSIRLHH